MLTLAKFFIAFVAGATIVAELSFADYLTKRNTAEQTSFFSEPFTTHGGVVYVTHLEHILLIAGWVLAGGLVIIQLILNRIESRNGNRDARIR